MMGNWPFIDSKNVATITTVDIIEGTNTIKYVTHDEDDGMWQFHSSEFSKEGDGRIVSLEEITVIDSTIMELADLPLGWIAIREHKDDNCKKFKK